MSLPPEPTNTNKMERELAAAIETSIATAPLPLVSRSNGQSRKAVDQLAQARDGLLKVEQELNQLCDAIAGVVDQANPVKPPIDKPEGLPMFDRVRADATTLAELAIRMHARIAHALERL